MGLDLAAELTGFTPVQPRSTSEYFADRSTTNLQFDTEPHEGIHSSVQIRFKKNILFVLLKFCPPLKNVFY